MSRSSDPFRRAEAEAFGIMRADPLGLLSIAEKHHGSDGVLELFQESFGGGVQLDDYGVAVYREFGNDEHDLPEFELLPLPPGLSKMKPMHFPQRQSQPRESAAARSSSTAKPKEKVPMAAAQPLKPPSTAAPITPSRMSVSSITRGKVQEPYRIVVYGPEGIGKSSFAAGAPGVVFMPVEDGSGHLDVARFPKPQTWKEIREGIRELITSPHKHETLVVDTLDAAEALLWRHMIERDVFVPSSKSNEKLRDIEDYGYGKGFQKALEDWRGFLKDLELLQERRGMNVVLAAHSQVRNFKNPAGPDYERYELLLNAKAAGLIKSWAKSVFFANYETFVKEEKGSKRVRGVDTGARFLFTERRAAYDAKHRGHVAEQIPLSWPDFVAEATKQIDPAHFAEAILKRAADLPADVQKLVAETIEKAAGNVQSLTSINNRVIAKLEEQATQKEET